jgi:hypothetical protein
MYRDKGKYSKLIVGCFLVKEPFDSLTISESKAAKEIAADSSVKPVDLQQRN